MRSKEKTRRQRRRRLDRQASQHSSSGSQQYRRLRHPFTAQKVFTDDAIANMHETALQVLQELGIKVLLPEARQILQQAGARIDEKEQIVFIGHDMVEAALQSAPRSFRLRSVNPARELVYEPGSLILSGSGGCPNAYDRIRGRRPGSLADFVDAVKLQQSFDVLHIANLSVEPQDIAPPFRHYEVLRTQARYSDKLIGIYARGRRQVAENFEMIQLALNLSSDEFKQAVWVKTVINTNSPRQLDIPMAEGIIDFARAGQLAVITPFCLAGAMAPVTLAGALVLQHAECLAGITLSQMTNPGTPVSYGGYSSNVDMKSGSPAFGTPEHVKLTIGTGQLARHIGMPWRTAAGSAASNADMQAANENLMGLWAAMQANATLVLHGAGWLEGGLSFGYEKFINDVEALQTLAELCLTTAEDEDSLGWSALTEVQPGGHFFAAQHTMSRYSTAFYSPLVADLSNYETWQENGSKTATERATAIWQQILLDFKAPPTGEEAAERLAEYIEEQKRSGGAPPVS